MAQENTQNTIPVDAARNPIVFQREGEVFANSKDVAAFFGKEHKHVLRDIRNLIENAPELEKSNFGPFKINDLTGESTSHYEMDRDGFTLLAMGFTGSKALKWKLRYIEAFRAMETEVQRLAAEGPVIDLNDPSQLRGLLLSYSEKSEQLEKQVQELLPAQEELDRIAKADGSMCVTDAAKTLQVRPKDLFDFLRSHGWIYSRPGTSNLAYQSKLASGLLEHKTTTVYRSDGSEKVTTQVRVTNKGLTRLAKEFQSVGELIH